MAGIQGVEEVKEKRSKGCRNPRSGDPRGSRNPRGQVLKSGRNSKGGALPAAREFRHSSPKLRLSPSELEVPSSRFFLSPRDPGFSPRELCLPRELRISRADFAFPSVILPCRARVLPFSAQAESLPVRFPPHAGFLCFFGAFIAEFYIFYFYE